MEDSSTAETTAEKPPWQPLTAIQRRVAGVMVEKAKTTPSAYPMTLNAICTASNQKSNRAPTMNLEPEDVETALDQLRDLGAIVEVHGDGRVPKYRHMMYEWLGVEKVELAVMAELLLRGGQTVGELRGRAARMDPIADVAALRPILESLKSKGLVIALNAEGRGHAVTHGLYRPEELEKVKARFAASDSSATPATAPPPRPPVAHSPAPQAAQAPAPPAPASAELEARVERMSSELRELRSQFDELLGKVRENTESIDEMRRDLGG